MAKALPVHLDKLGREIQLDNCIAFPDSNSLKIGKVVKINPKMIGVQEIGNKRWLYSGNKYPADIVILDGQEVTVWLLKEAANNG